ncbi:putative component of type VI protein secretion system [Pelomonas saccharophila]|uniref:Component of type VI protein secretion system n=1 Tax=Roseateles saccharophilus TaxID=304 RepID=A0ABU1YH21_ROSSA|nr:hypothetical protein [Roseateles saccharophilus]MDR7268142.1 putative component of type VI protein secretion system [Roseateles saccharophilus]
MRFVLDFLVGGITAVIVTSAACAQPAPSSSPPASAPETAASRVAPDRNPALTASENAKEPGVQRPEERVVPQISVPLRSRNITAPAAPPASAPVGSRPGGVNDAAARCLAADSAKTKAACEGAGKASEPAKAAR